MKSRVLLADAIVLSLGLTLSACSTHHDLAATPPAAAPLPSSGTSTDVPVAGRKGYGAPECLYCPAPQYSSEARHERIQGEVVLDLVVGADGKAHDIYVARSLGHGLDEQAVKAVRDVWKFKPAKGPDGKPAAVRMLIDIVFHLY